MAVFLVGLTLSTGSPKPPPVALSAIPSDLLARDNVVGGGPEVVQAHENEK
jgi:hypothetical protein